jgi:hypothetical protein
MGKLLTITALILTAGVTTGCNQCMQGSYYDPCGGVVYGPSVNPPSFLSGLGKNKHDKHSCPLCASEAQAGSHGSAGSHRVNGNGACSCGHAHGTQHPTPTNYGAAFGQPTPLQNGRSPCCDCPSPQNCAAGCSARVHKPNCRGERHPSGCNCATPIANCEQCCPSEYHPPTPCDACSTCGDSYSTYGDSYSGAEYDESWSSEPMILPGETIIPGDNFTPRTFTPQTFSSGSCPECEANSSGPIFTGTIIPETEASKPTDSTPAPAAESAQEAAPGEQVTPVPDPLSTTMKIPDFPAPKPARQVHWVPNALK